MRILIVDDHKLFVEAICPTLGELGVDDIHVASNGRDALDVVERVHPDVVLMDLGLPDRSGLSVGREILERWPHMKVVALTAIDDPNIVRQARRAGFIGYVTKDTSVPQFASAIKAAIEGRPAVSRRLANGDDRRVADDRVRLLAEQLTARERDVLALLAMGMSSIDIGRNLSISTNTVRSHIQSIFGKLQIHSRLEAVVFAVRHGLVATGRGRRAMKDVVGHPYNVAELRHRSGDRGALPS